MNEQGSLTVILVLKIPLDARWRMLWRQSRVQTWDLLHKWGSHTTGEKVFSKQEVGFVHLCVHRSGRRAGTQ